MKGNEAGACAAPEPRTRAVTALDPQLRMLVGVKNNFGSRCCLEEPGRLNWSRCASGPAAKPPTRMLRIRGKPGNNPQAKVAGFFQRRYIARCGSRGIIPLVGPGVKPQRYLVV